MFPAVHVPTSAISMTNPPAFQLFHNPLPDQVLFHPLIRLRSSHP